VMPLYRGIETLRKEGDAVQWGGALLAEGGVFPNMPNGRARFFPLERPRVTIPPGSFFLASRRGKQFNSITFGANDGMTGVRSREVVFMSTEDAGKLGVKTGDALRLRSDLGTMDVRCQIGPCRPGHLQAFWPECNVLVGRRYDPTSGEPDYNAFVKVEVLETR
jgi:anaerobic selenocysteine-containing dehydrogenase